MKCRLLILLGVLFMGNSCSDDKEINTQPANITLNFNHFWGNSRISNTDFNTVKFTNANGERLSMERLRYLISDIKLTDENDTVITFNEYNLVDVTNNENLSFTTTGTVSPGNYTHVSFRFGFSNTDNRDGEYADLNTANFNVPGILGGGYHYMQFNYHAVRAVDRTVPANLVFQDTSFEVNLGVLTVGSNTRINIKADISEWFNNPNTWDLNVLNTLLMPNFNAQLMISANGKSVFSLESVTQ